MNFIKHGMLILSLAVAAPGYTCTEDGKEGIVPEHNLKIEVNDKRTGGITEEDFHAVIDKVENIYAPIVEEMGGNLKVARNWEDGTVNAYASRAGRTWNVSMFGGLARHETITADGFALVICHEIGHHIGGAPKKASIWSNSWASNEGQADYFATLKCLRRTFLNDDNQKIISEMDVPETLTNSCLEAWESDADRAICIRNGMAGDSVAKLFAALRNNAEPGKFETPDPRVVSRTDDNHPAHQCRLDTYFQGALCHISLNEEVSQDDEVEGTCHASLGHANGLRPLCWFKASVE